MKFTESTLAVAALASLVAGCAKQSADRGLAEEKPLPVVQAEPTPEKEPAAAKVDAERAANLIDTALAQANATEFVEALREAGLDAELARGDVLYTIFVPTNEAFDRARLGQDKAELTRLLRYYIVPGRLTSRELAALAATPTTAGQELSITVDPDGDFFVVNQARVVKPNIEARGGVVHVVDAMLLPPEHEAAPALRDEALLGTINLDPTLAEACGIPRQRVYFRLDSAQLRMAADDPLTEIATCVTSGPLAGQALRIAGFTDPRGSEPYNKTLGARRAASVAEYLEDRGVPADQLRQLSHGEVFAHEDKPRFWDFDRRVDISLVTNVPPPKRPATPPSPPTPTTTTGIPVE